MIAADYIVVGAGLTGTVIARALHDSGREVIILDRRSHTGGNVHDHTHPSGIRIHTYGPHYFRTSSDQIWDFVTRYADFDRYEAALLSDVNGNLENWPIAASYITKHIGADWKPEFNGTPTNFKEAALSLMPRSIYVDFIKEYNEKQWGIPADLLAADLCRRFEVREDDEPRLKPNAKYQGIPANGYHDMMVQMQAGIPVVTNTDYLKQRDQIEAKKGLIFTGPIDEFFDFELGKLAYRGQRREHRYLPDVDFAQPCGQVNNPQHAGGPHIRTLEWKRMIPIAFAERIKGTVLTTETPYSPTNPTDYEYPFPNEKNASLYKQYRKRANALKDTLICGRLGEYRYYDMDQAISRAMFLAKRLLDKG